MTLDEKLYAILQYFDENGKDIDGAIEAIKAAFSEKDKDEL